MKALAWLAMVLAGILALGFFLVFIDLVSTKITNGSASAYLDMALALGLFCGSAYVASRSIRRIRSEPHHTEAATPH